MNKLAEIADSEEAEIYKQMNDSFKNNSQPDDVDLTEDYFDIFNSYHDKHSPIFPIEKTSIVPLISK